MDGFTSIKRPPEGVSPLYNPPPNDECFDHCITLNGADLEKLGVSMPDKGDLVHLNVMAKVVGCGDDHGHRYVRIEIEDVLFVENETTEKPDDDKKK